MVHVRKGKYDPRFEGVEDFRAVNFWKKSIPHRGISLVQAGGQVVGTGERRGGIGDDVR